LWYWHFFTHKSRYNTQSIGYDLKAYTYKDVKQIKVSTRTFDSQATVELPEDLTLKEGENKFEIKVTSENQKVTKVYTLIITKDAKK
jgi:restriction endonuclease